METSLITIHGSAIDAGHTPTVLAAATAAAVVHGSWDDSRAARGALSVLVIAEWGRHLTQRH
jgi:hypothetical protein